MAKTIDIDLLSGMRFDATGEDGTVVELDSAEEHGGVGGGFRPMELMLISLGGCTAMDVVSILRKKRQELTSYRVQVTGEQQDEYPHVYTDISIRHIFRGNGVDEQAVAHAIELSETKCCPAYAMLSKAARITTSFEVQPDTPKD